MSRSVVVTGASTGIGRATVRQLVGAGFDVWATVRRQADADGLTAELGDPVTPLLVDLGDEASVRAAGDRVRAAGPLHGLVNNAGMAMAGPLELLPIESFRRQLEVNLTGQLLMTQVMLPALFEAADADGDARIVMVGSIGGRIAGPVLGAYQAAKHGLVGLTDALRAELAPFGVRVVLIEPGMIATPIWQRGGEAAAAARAEMAGAERYADQIAGAQRMARRGAARGLSPDVPAKVIVTALTSPRPAPRRVVGRDAAVVAAMVRVLPFRVLYKMLAARRGPGR